MTISLFQDRVVFRNRSGDRREITQDRRTWAVDNGDVGTVTCQTTMRLRGQRVPVFSVKFDHHDGVFPRPFNADDVDVIDPI